MSKKKFTDEELIKAHSEGLTMIDIAKRFNCTTTPVRMRLDKQGLDLPKYKKKEEQPEEKEPKVKALQKKEEFPKRIKARNFDLTKGCFIAVDGEPTRVIEINGDEFFCRKVYGHTASYEIEDYECDTKKFIYISGELKKQVKAEDKKAATSSEDGNKPKKTEAEENEISTGRWKDTTKRSIGVIPSEDVKASCSEPDIKKSITSNISEITCSTCDLFQERDEIDCILKRANAKLNEAVDILKQR